MNVMKVVYGLGIGLMLAAVVGVGIYAFYQPPGYYGSESAYGRNILIIHVISGLAFSLLGLLLVHRFNAIRLGLLTGGLITLIAGLIVSASRVEFEWVFTAAFMVLAILVAAGYYSLVMRKEAKE